MQTAIDAGLADPRGDRFGNLLGAPVTDSARVDKWFRRNCKDVLARECSAAEKADVLAYLIGLGR